MSDANFPIDRKRMADGSVKPASNIHVPTNGAADPPPPPSSACASAAAAEPKLKPAFRPAKDDTKPTLRDPVRRFINLYRLFQDLLI